MTRSPNEAELEIIFEKLRQEFLTDVDDLRSDASLVNEINRGLRYWRLKNLGDESKDTIREIGIRRRPEILHDMRVERQRQRRTIGVSNSWNARQIRELNDLYSKKYIPVERIAYRTGKTKGAVYSKAHREGLKRGKINA